MGFFTESRLRWGEYVVVALLYAAATIYILDPILDSPSTKMFNPGGMASADTILIMWILSWGWHALTTDPANLFNANIFHPVPGMLTGSEHMLGYQPFFGPILGATQNPLLAFNIANLVSFATTGLGLYLLLRHWRVHPLAAFFGGFVYAFSPVRLSALHSLQLAANGFLPLALLFFDRVLFHNRLRDAVGFAVFLVWQVLCSVYIGFFTAIGVALYALSALVTGFRTIRLRGLMYLSAVSLASVVVVGVIHLPFVERTRGGVITDHRDSAMLKTFSNDPLGSLSTSPGSIRKGEQRLFRGRSAYVGWFPLLGILGCLLRRRGAPPWGTFGLFLIMSVGHILSVGPETRIAGAVWTMPYSYLSDWVPGFSSMRVPSRFSYLSMLGLAGMVGVGWGRWLDLIERWVPGGSIVGPMILLLAIPLTSYEYDHRQPKLAVTRRPVRLTDLPQQYQVLASLPKGPVLSAPIGRNANEYGRMGYYAMYRSIFHWQPLLNGATAYEPPAAKLIEVIAARLPAKGALRLLCRATGLKYVLLHTRGLTRRRIEEWNDLGMELLSRSRDLTLFEVDCPNADLMELLLTDRPERTLSGTRVRRLAPAEREAKIEIVRGVGRTQTSSFRIRVTNLSTASWPVLTTDVENAVSLGMYWTGARSRARTATKSATLGRDVGPLGSVEFDVLSSRPRYGKWRLKVGLLQAGEWFAEPIAVPVEP